MCAVSLPLNLVNSYVEDQLPLSLVSKAGPPSHFTVAAATELATTLGPQWEAVLPVVVRSSGGRDRGGGP